jgi:sugar/nucleoside kinase (ribokinase family)
MINYVSYSVIIDDLVFSDGRTAMGVLGGSGPQTAFGMRLFADGVGLCGAQGGDFPADARAWLDGMGIDCAGMKHYPQLSSLRAWQITEWDGRRIQVWRSKPEEISQQLPLRYENIPPNYLAARGFFYGVHPHNPNLGVARRLRDHGMVVGIEVFRHADRLLSGQEIHELASAAHILSPNLWEAETMLGPAAPEEQARRLNDAGAEIVALRMGEDGSLLRCAATGECVHVPAVATHVVDPTGAGNAYCGGLIVGWVETGDLRTAGLYGAVAASFLVEQVGLPPVGRDDRTIAQERLRAISRT